MKNLSTILLIFFLQIGFGQESQNQEMKTIETKRYTVYKAVKKGYNKTLFQKATKSSRHRQVDTYSV